MKALKVISVEIHRIRLPLRIKVAHALAARRETENVVLKLTLDDGSTGYGECVPREYVTRETAESVVQALTSQPFLGILGLRLQSLRAVKDYLQSLSLVGAAGCAFELAVIDAFARGFGSRPDEIVGPLQRSAIYYSAVIPGLPLRFLRRAALCARIWGFPAVKVKVGVEDDDLERVRLVRQVLGRRIDLRVDANGAWDPEQAVEKIRGLRQFNVSLVEEPTHPREIDGLSYVARHSPIPICVDESLTTEADAHRLIDGRACHIFNLRLSKCGGILNTLKLAALAKARGLRYQVGCQIGESSILSAAGRHLLMRLDDTLYAEGSFGRLLLKRDVARSVVGFGFRGKGRALGGPGLGFQIDPEALARQSIEHSRFTLT